MLYREKNVKSIFVNLAYLFSLFGEFLRDMRAQKKRTVLTIFGIIWGTAAVVVMMAVGSSTKRQNLTNFRGIGDGIILMWPGTTTKPYEGFGVDRRIRLQDSDVELLKSEIPEIGMICAEYQRWDAYMRHGKQIRNPLVTGCPPRYWNMRNIIPKPGGRFLNELDMEEKRRVVFLGTELKDFLCTLNGCLSFFLGVEIRWSTGIESIRIAGRDIMLIQNLRTVHQVLWSTHLVR